MSSSYTDQRLLAFFPDAIIELNKEVLNHPELQKNLCNHPADEFEIRLAEIATYCKVILDGRYTGEDYIKIAEICVKKLKAMRPKAPIIIVDSGDLDVNRIQNLKGN